MKEITQDNYKDLEFNFHGIVIAYPKVDLYFNSEFYFIKQKIDYDTNKRYYITCGYNEEDQTCEGLAPDRLETNIENTFNCWSQMNYYQFENMKEFCEWYLYKDDKIKKSIKDFKETTMNSPLYSIPVTDPTELEHLNKLLKTESQKAYKHKKAVSYFEQKYGFNPYEEQAPEELGYWEIYNDENCDDELKRIIEKKFPEIKELASLDAKIIKNKISSTYTFDEMRDKINPGWNTRRQQLQDVLKLLELRDLRQNTIDMLVENMPPEKRCFLEKQLERDEKRIEDFLNEVI